MTIAKWINFSSIDDSRGSLIAIEANKTIPFEIKRIYYLYGNKDNVTRGMHAHKNLTQVIISISGSCKISLDNGHTKENVLLKNPDRGILVENFIWREMSDFSANCVLLVLASELYDESDYIRDYNLFKKFVEHD